MPIRADVLVRCRVHDEHSGVSGQDGGRPDEELDRPSRWTARAVGDHHALGRRQTKREQARS